MHLNLCVSVVAWVWELRLMCRFVQVLSKVDFFFYSWFRGSVLTLPQPLSNPIEEKSGTH